MTITRLLLAELEEDALALLNSSTLLGSPGFMRCWETVGGKPIVWAIHEDGGSVAMLPAVEFRGKPFTRFQAMPDGLYLRLARSTSDPGGAAYQEALLKAILSYGYARVYLTDYFRELGETVRMWVTMHATQLIELTSTWEPPDAKLRSEIRKAEREGIAIARFDPNAHLAGFLSLMRSTEGRHGRKQKYPESFFEALAKLSLSDNRVRWYFVEQDGIPVVSQIFLVEGETALNWQIYYDKQFSSLKANQLMLYTAAKELQREGVRFLSLGATPDDAEGLKIFKEKWGGFTATYPCFEHRSLIGKLI